MKVKQFRKLEIVTEPYGSSYRPMAVAKCCVCAREEHINARASSSILPDEVIAKKFVRKGWELGANAFYDTCPSCVAARREKKPNLTVVKEMEEMKPVLVDAEPRVMQRDDRRIVFEKLNDVYLDERRGYDKGWSDGVVAEDLGVPRAWVEQVREEMFGPLGTNPDIDEFKKGVSELREIKAQLEEYRMLIQRIDLPKVLGTIARLERLEAEVKKHIP